VTFPIPGASLTTITWPADPPGPDTKAALSGRSGPLAGRTGCSYLPWHAGRRQPGLEGRPSPPSFSRRPPYAQGGDFEGVLTYGIGIRWPVAHSNPQIPVRTYEVETFTASGQHRYTVAIDIDASNPA